MMRDVMPAPERRHRRDSEQQASTGRELRPEGCQRLPVVRNMLQHVEQHDQVIMAVVERHVGQIAAFDREAGPLRGKGTGMIVRLDRVDRAELLQHGDVGAGAAPDLQDTQRSRTRAPAFYQRRQNLATSDKPPMIPVDLGHAVIDVAFHQSSSSPASPIRSRTM